MGPGHLPDSGGVNDQAAWTLEAFDILENALGELRKAMQDKKAEYEKSAKGN